MRSAPKTCAAETFVPVPKYESPDTVELVAMTRLIKSRRDQGALSSGTGVVGSDGSLTDSSYESLWPMVGARAVPCNLSSAWGT